MKIFLRVALDTRRHAKVHGDIRFQPPILRERSQSLEIAEPHSIIKVQFEYGIIDQIVHLEHEVVHQFEILRGTGAGELPGYEDMGINQQLHLYAEAHMGEGLLVVCVMEFARVVPIALNDITHILHISQPGRVETLPDLLETQEEARHW